ncbi:hypothetical protein, conserved [Eimeria tenella]|uniref:Uncharacterized protein n=1 Tax=Eimeria tenella TaxID=5802 RepID=U6KZ25_EIMTE|nr:hypothetical protein, conserved [Eimeria tenella]CDJ40755.1 hypothetical protein, conserved [Eimeria tenella]|eukprot:XP_013231505.1 hypothetical protein, conserved [Eimeria tenella]
MSLSAMKGSFRIPPEPPEPPGAPATEASAGGGPCRAFIAGELPGSLSVNLPEDSRDPGEPSGPPRRAPGLITRTVRLVLSLGAVSRARGLSFSQGPPDASGGPPLLTRLLILEMNDSTIRRAPKGGPSPLLGVVLYARGEPPTTNSVSQDGSSSKLKCKNHSQQPEGPTIIRKFQRLQWEGAATASCAFVR